MHGPEQGVKLLHITDDDAHLCGMYAHVCPQPRTWRCYQCGGGSLAANWHTWMAFVPGGISAGFQIGGIADMCVFGGGVQLVLSMLRIRSFDPPRCLLGA